MKWITRLIAFVIAYIATGLFLIAAVDMAVSRAMLSTTTYRAAFNNDQFARNLVPSILTAMAEGSRNGDLDVWPFEAETLAERVDANTWAAATEVLVPESWVSEQVERLISLFDGILNDETTVVQETIHLQLLKQNLESEPAITAANRLIDALPDCTFAETELIQAIANGDETRLPLCKPTAEFRDYSVTTIVQWLNNIGQMLPATTNLEAIGITANSIQGLHLLVEINWQVVSLLFLCPTALLFLVVFLVVKSLRSFGRWTGIVVIMSGLAILGALFLLQAITINTMTDVWQTNTPQERFFAQIILSLVRAAFLQSSTTLLLLAAIFFAVGFILLMVASYAPQAIPELFEIEDSHPSPEDGTTPNANRTKAKHDHLIES